MATVAVQPMPDISPSVGGGHLEKTTTHLNGVVPANSEVLDPEWRPQEIQKIVQEGFLLLSGIAAILLQVAHPGVGQGVDNHSNFAYRPTDRLRTTMTYIYCMVYGTPEEKKIIVNMVNKAHSAVNGPGYNAFDPHLQLWVAATLYACGTDIYQKFTGPMDEERAERTYKEYACMAVSLQVPPELWPADRQAFWRYWDDMVGKLEVTPAARNIARDLLDNKSIPLWIRTQMPMIRIMTAEWLPPSVRDAYELDITKSSHRKYRLSMRIVRGLNNQLPVLVRSIPMRYYLRDMRKRIKKYNGVK